MKEKLIRSVISSFIVVLLICFEWKLSFNVVHDFESLEREYTVEDFEQVNGYSVEGNTLIPINDDPQAVLNLDGNIVNQVTIVLAEAVQDDVAGQIYLYRKRELSEKNSVKFYLEKGKLTQVLNVNKDSAGYVRIDLDGAYSLDHIQILSQQSHINVFKLLLFVILCVILNILVFVLFYKKIYNLCVKLVQYFNKADSAIVKLGEKFKINICRVYVAMALILGISYSFLLPIGMVPDEGTHILFMCNSVGVSGVHEQYNNLLDQGNMINHVLTDKEIVDRELYHDISTVKFDKSIVWRPSGITKDVIRYAPCGLGFWIGYKLNLPILWCAQLGELFSVFFFVIIGYITLKIMPVYREVLCAIMLLPMNIQQCSSFNYDSVLLPLCYLFFAYIMYLKYRKEQVNLKSYAVMIVLLALIALIKIPYILLGGLYFIIPDERKKYKIDRRVRAAIICVAVVVGGIGVYLMRNSFFVYSVLGSIFEIRETLRIFSMTIRQFCVFYMQGIVGIFGWLDCYLPNWLVLFSLVSIVVFAQIPQQKIAGERVRNRVLLVIISLAISVLIMIGLLQWFMIYQGIDISSMTLFRQGLSQVSVIYGVQGRYWLPVLPCFVFALANIIPNKENKMVIWQCCYYVFIAVVPIYELTYRYWV